MSVSKNDLLGVLPPYLNNVYVIKEDQNIHDIVREVLNAHKVFKIDYDIIYPFFDVGSIKDICINLFDFCKHNITYVIEREEQQTTRSPAAILALGYGDCKHYAGFIGGVLSAINRHTDLNIDWCYTFASYSLFDEDVQHVFITVRDKGNTYWIDPVLCCFNSRKQIPVFKIDKKINDMLTRVSGIGVATTQYNPLTMIDYGSDYLKINAATQAVEIPTDLNDIEMSIPAELQDNIKMLLYYGIIDSSNNVFYDVYVNTLNSLSEQSDKDALTAAFGKFIDALNQNSIGDIFGDIWNSVKQISLAPARGAYLALVSLNVFGLASKMYAIAYNPDGSTYQPGVDQLQAVWHKKLLGDTNLLLRAIRNGHPKKAIFGTAPPMQSSTTPINPAIPALTAATAAIPGVNAWVALAATIITALSPVILAALKSKQAAGFDVTSALNIPQPQMQSSLQQYLPYLLIGGVALYFIMEKK